MRKLMEKIEECGFECEAGPLSGCTDWQDLKEAAAEIVSALKELSHMVYGELYPDHPTVVRVQRALANAGGDV